MGKRIVAFDLDVIDFLASAQIKLLSLEEVGAMFTGICEAADRGDAAYLRPFQFIGKLYAETLPRSRMSRELRARIIERDGGRCRRCGSIDELEIDHIKPVVFGGTDDDENLQTLCRVCNRRKGPQAHARTRELNAERMGNGHSLQNR